MSLHQDPTQTAVRRQKRSLWTDAWRRMRRSHTAVIGMILFALIVIVCFSAPLFSDYDAQVINSDLAMIRKYPVEGHPLGTDGQGRDVLSRLIWGARPTLVAGIVPADSAVLAGVGVDWLPHALVTKRIASITTGRIDRRPATAPSSVSSRCRNSSR